MAEDDKQRFSLIPLSASPSNKAIPTDDQATSSALKTSDEPETIVQPEIHASDDPSEYLIRANQGHSIAVESEGLLQPVTDADIPDTVVHGTTHGAWPLIVQTGGLKRMTRTHVHFASGLPAGFKSVADEQTGPNAQHGDAKVSEPVISGMRNSSSVLVFLDIHKAMAAGLKFWRSENGVILCEGDADGVIALDCFKKVEDRTGGLGILVRDGQIVKEAPEAWAKKGTGRRGGRGGGGGGGGGGRGRGK